MSASIFVQERLYLRQDDYEIGQKVMACGYKKKGRKGGKKK